MRGLAVLIHRTHIVTPERQQNNHTWWPRVLGYGGCCSPWGLRYFHWTPNAPQVGISAWLLFLNHKSTVSRGWPSPTRSWLTRFVWGHSSLHDAVKRWPGASGREWQTTCHSLLAAPLSTPTCDWSRSKSGAAMSSHHYLTAQFSKIHIEALKIHIFILQRDQNDPVTSLLVVIITEESQDFAHQRVFKERRYLAPAGALDKRWMEYYTRGNGPCWLGGLLKGRGTHERRLSSCSFLAMEPCSNVIMWDEYGLGEGVVD